jgi:hypothetical protein
MDNPWIDRGFAMLARGCTAALLAHESGLYKFAPGAVLVLTVALAMLYEVTGVVAKRFVPSDAARLEIGKDVR